MMKEIRKGDYRNALKIDENTEMDISEESKELKRHPLLEVLFPSTITALSVSIGVGCLFVYPKVAPLLIPSSVYGFLNAYNAYNKYYKKYKDKIGEDYKLK